MKKIISFLLVLCIAAAMAGCATNTNTSPDASASPDNQNTNAAPKIKVGMSYYTFADMSGMALKDELKYTSDQFGNKVVFQEWPSFDTEGILSSVSSLINNGCNGVIATLMFPGMLEDAKEAGSQIILFGNEIGDPTLLKQAESSENFVGAIEADSLQTGYDMAQGLYDSGVRNWMYTAPPLGTSASFDKNVQGILNFVSEHPDVNLLAEVRDLAGTADTARQVWMAHPELDGFLLINNDGTVLNAIYSDGLQTKIKVAALEILGNMEKYFNDGCLVWVAGGWHPMVQLAYTLLYNKLTGHDLIEDKSVPVYYKYIVVRNVQEYKDYLKTIAQSKDPVYNGDELKNLCVAYNPDATLDTLKEYIDNYSVQDVLTRHSN